METGKRSWTVEFNRSPTRSRVLFCSLELSTSRVRASTTACWLHVRSDIALRETTLWKRRWFEWQAHDASRRVGSPHLASLFVGLDLIPAMHGFRLARVCAKRSTRAAFVSACVTEARVWVVVGVLCGCTWAEYRTRAAGRLKSGGHCTRATLAEGASVRATALTHTDFHPHIRLFQPYLSLLFSLSLFLWTVQERAHAPPLSTGAIMHVKSENCAKRCERSSGKTSFQLLAVFHTTDQNDFNPFVAADTDAECMPFSGGIWFQR